MKLLQRFTSPLTMSSSSATTTTSTTTTTTLEPPTKKQKKNNADEEIKLTSSPPLSSSPPPSTLSIHASTQQLGPPSLREQDNSDWNGPFHFVQLADTQFGLGESIIRAVLDKTLDKMR